VLRIFGETPGGQKACLHIHRLFPYLYVPYDDDLPRGADGATAFLRGLAEALDRALDFGERAAAADARAPGATPAAGAGGGARRADGFMHDAYMRQVDAPSAPRGGPGDPAARPFAPREGGGPAGFARKRNPIKQVVRECALVRARSMYGFHAHERLFVKISLFDPACMSRVRAALLSGGVADRTFQPFEAHVPFPLQAMMDLNLTGAGVVRCAEACFREPTPRWPRAHTRRVAARRRLRLGGAAMEEEEGASGRATGTGTLHSRRRRGPLELEFEDAEPAGAYGARAEDAEASQKSKMQKSANMTRLRVPNPD
jgi:DNA polymerase zeta